jgi:putative photosynthetic complex assembly protein
MSALHPHNAQIPRPAFWFAGVMIATTLTAAAAVRLGALPVAANPVTMRAATAMQPLMVRDLSFVDRPDGGITVTDAKTGTTRHTIAAFSDSGFIRGVLRGMSRDRAMRGVGPTAPYRLAAWPNGQLSLTDPATGRVVELSSFGETNRQTFLALMR